MDNILYEKPKGHLKKLAVAGFVASLLFLIFYVLIDVTYSQTMLQMYGVQTGASDFVSLFLSINGLFAAAALAFFIGLFLSKNRRFFVKLMLWVLLLADLYVVMPSISTLVQVFASYTGLQLVYYVGLLLPQLLIAVLLVSFMAQKDAPDKKPTRVLAWISIFAGVVLFVFQIVYTISNAPQTDLFNVLYFITGPIAIAFIVCLAAAILLACQTPSEKTEPADESVKKEGEQVEEEDEQLDEVVEKIACAVCKEDDKEPKETDGE